jgi:hypothetical protein
MQQPASTTAAGALRADRACGTPCTADLCARTNAFCEAIRLTQLGARAGLVAQLTGIEKAAANRLYRQIRGRSSPSGLLPFTDAWYLKDERRLLQTSIVWHLSQRLAHPELSPAGRLLEVYGAYRWLVPAPLLDITRVAFVRQLVAMLDWQEQTCRTCATRYLVPAGSLGALCFGCRRFAQQRCRACGTPLPRQPPGRTRELCTRCLRAQPLAASRRCPA